MCKIEDKYYFNREKKFLIILARARTRNTNGRLNISDKLQNFLSKYFLSHIFRFKLPSITRLNNVVFRRN